ncbi:Chaperone of endosialidase [Sphingobium sp. AP50]|uniref:tail fiber domain-containing protein n=1 Tax=Sphingobium sp. AP50 TaxID=1884369 RepID=UPI0008D4734C|nr:tail fiber domain-containing protein [Sphingobium sp. AP50]SEI67938.1 Chaperone of endosialidase [Sphingobium sp. AP50]
MTQQQINTGTTADDGTGDPLRTAFGKANLNFTELYGFANGSAPDGGTPVGSDRLHGSSADAACDWSYNQVVEFVMAMATGFSKSLTMDGVAAAAERAFAINVTSGYSSRYNHYVDGVLRWGTARLATGHWVVRRYDATGAAIDNPIDIDDVTGAVTFPNAITTNSQTINGVGAAATRELGINVDAGYSGGIRWRTGTSSRWMMSKTGTAETGSNAGSNFSLSRQDDAGTTLGTPFTVNRATGLTTIAEGLAVSGTGGAATGFSSLGVTSSTTTAPINIDSIAGQYAITRYRTGTTTRWDLGKETTAEGGSNVGSDFSIRSFTDGGSVRAVTLRISRANGDISFEGNLIPTADNVKSLGTGSFRMSVIYAGTGTINTSDERAKQEIGPVPDALLDAWGNVEWRQYRFIDSYALKGEDARWHFGLIAQHVRDAIDAALGEGSAIRLGLVCHDEWDAAPAQFVPEMHFVTRQDDVEVEEPTGNMIEVSPAIEAGDRWGLRYDECFALEAAWQRRRMDRIEAQIAALTA